MQDTSRICLIDSSPGSVHIFSSLVKDLLEKTTPRSHQNQIGVFTVPAPEPSRADRRPHHPGCAACLYSSNGASNEPVDNLVRRGRWLVVKWPLTAELLVTPVGKRLLDDDGVPQCGEKH